MTSEKSINDLSPYELARLERIKRNENRLRELGLVKPTPKPKLKPQAAALVRKRKQPSSSVPTRSSRRLRELKEGKTTIEDDENGDDTEKMSIIEEDTAVDYNRMPDDPERLDDDEFQVYVSLRSWRLRRKNELEIEPYKICQNRTLCELIRRRRNDPNFACKGKEVDEIEQNLLSVWGLGPSKASEGGFGWEMLNVMNTDENEKFLAASRRKDEK
jgi:superfamily II DNA helicase RecQ